MEDLEIKDDEEEDSEKEEVEVVKVAAASNGAGEKKDDQEKEAVSFRFLRRSSNDAPSFVAREIDPPPFHCIPLPAS